MKIEDAYIEVVDRSIDAAKATFMADRHEATAFYAYHAFESLGGAYCTSAGETYSKDHAKKINQFVNSTNKNHIPKKVALSVSAVAIAVASLRNKCLYPQQVTGSPLITPSQFISKKDAEKLLKRVQGVTAAVKKHI